MSEQDKANDYVQAILDKSRDNGGEAWLAAAREKMEALQRSGRAVGTRHNPLQLPMQRPTARGLMGSGFPVEVERTAIREPEVRDANLPMALWLQKYSREEYLAIHNVDRVFDDRMADRSGRPDRLLEMMRYDLQRSLWGERSIISVETAWGVRHFFHQEEPRWLSTFDSMMHYLTSLDRSFDYQGVIRMRAISMPMRPTPLGCIT